MRVRQCPTLFPLSFLIQQAQNGLDTSLHGRDMAYTFLTLSHIVTDLRSIERHAISCWIVNDTQVTKKPADNKRRQADCRLLSSYSLYPADRSPARQMGITVDVETANRHSIRWLHNHANRQKTLNNPGPSLRSLARRAAVHAGTASGEKRV